MAIYYFIPITIDGEPLPPDLEQCDSASSAYSARDKYINTESIFRAHCSSLHYWENRGSAGIIVEENSRQSLELA